MSRVHDCIRTIVLAGVILSGHLPATPRAQAAEEPPQPMIGGQLFDGSGECYFELGGGQAMQMQGHFFRAVDERIEVSPPSAEALAAKEEFERERLERWFG